MRDSIIVEHPPQFLTAVYDPEHFMSKLSTLAETLPGSQILAISQSIKKRIAAGETIYNLTVGDFDSGLFPIPEKLEVEIIRAYLQRHTNYPPLKGI